MKLTMKPSRWWLWTCLILTATGFMVWWYALRSDPIGKQVAQSLRNLSKSTPTGNAAELSALGPAILPYLAQYLQLRETAFDRFYAQRWPKLPAFIQKYLPQPRSKSQLRQRAIEVIYEIGAAAARPLTSVLCRQFDETNAAMSAY